MTARERRGKFLGDFMFDRVRYRVTFDTRAEAEAWERQSRIDLDAGKPVQRPKLARRKKAAVVGNGLNTLQDILKHVAEVHWRDLKSAPDQMRNAQRFVDFVGRRVSMKEALAPEILGNYVLHLRKAGRSSGTINRHLACISKLARVAWKAEKIQAMPDIPWQKESVRRTTVLTHDEVYALIQQTRQWGYTREADMFQFLIDTGCRLGEASKVRWCDFEEEFRSVTFARDITKTSADRTIPLFPTSVEALKRCQLSAGQSDGPFHRVRASRLRSVWQRLKAVLKFGKGATIHTLRHTRCTWFAREGWDFWRIQKWMGHSALVTTRRYTNLVSNDLDGMVTGGPRTPSEPHLPKQAPADTAASPPRFPAAEAGHRDMPTPRQALEQRIALLQAGYGQLSKEQLIGLCVMHTLRGEGLLQVIGGAPQQASPAAGPSPKSAERMLGHFGPASTG